MKYHKFDVLKQIILKAWIVLYACFDLPIFFISESYESNQAWCQGSWFKFPLMSADVSGSVIFPFFWEGLSNLTDIQADHSYSLSEDSAPQSPALSIKMDEESGGWMMKFLQFLPVDWDEAGNHHADPHYQGGSDLPSKSNPVPAT